MNDQDPFNPAIPPEFQLGPPNPMTEHANEEPGIGAELIIEPPSTNGKSKRDAKQTAGSRKKKNTAANPETPKQKKSRISWNRLKDQINTRLGSLDKEKLKTALTACGLAAGVVAAVVFAVKLVPIAVLLLALVGLVVVIRIWDRLRRGPDYL